MINKIFPFSILLALLTSSYAQAESTAAQSAKPLTPDNMNHLFYTPTTRVNDKDEITISFHEAAYGLGNKVQVQFSLFDNVGRSNFGIKYQLADSFVLGAGLGATFASLPNGNHGLHSNDKRIALYLTKQVANTKSTDVYFTGHTQIGDVASFGLDLGINIKQAPNFNIILEAGTSYDTNSENLYMNADGGLRIFPETIPNTYFDFGLDYSDFNFTLNGEKNIKIYLDAGYHF
ncbi:hypothetical protein [Marinicellulosiphila megalodicopiae]|uniref:hypothetical protein n=1 Tax=Marinicellulosiphila megalodicopiae TaxID=2724896 RepID=UPI003BB118B2